VREYESDEDDELANTDESEENWISRELKRQEASERNQEID